MVRLKPEYLSLSKSFNFDFNPTMVRLKPLIQNSLCFIFSNFNPTMVRLKLHQNCLLHLYHQNFNPTMVRLKPSVLNENDLFGYEFQSHNGSIKTLDGAEKQYLSLQISIPQWFD